MSHSRDKRRIRAIGYRIAIAPTASCSGLHGICPPAGSLARQPLSNTRAYKPASLPIIKMHMQAGCCRWIAIATKIFCAPHFSLLYLINQAVISAKTWLNINNKALKTDCFIYPTIFNTIVTMKNSDTHIQKQTIENQ
ncbi:hypothetical protein [Aeromonas dhakensis]|uniref:hypothetical protein n=1 Tax=Aeromonas dhakensis TaxID=196024 RepID=UPI001BFC6359|nr:hypothetical protein [Aeromonas dhakensis]MED7774652.1 hypothetical protein [Aeromonas dhakensis]HDT5888296.1 hypothetical protein [Aeromonas dhakensis]HEB4980428.1 hypothetical protein [Aeromonas dhakensis]